MWHAHGSDEDSLIKMLPRDIQYMFGAGPGMNVVVTYDRISIFTGEY